MKKPLEPKRIVFLADTHIGSRVGLANPRDCTMNDAHAPVREALFKIWESETKGEWAKPDALILDGDMLDGQGRKSGGTEQWTTSITEQIDHAVDLIRMWNAKKIYVIRGSDYHVDQGGLPCEELLARELEAEEYPGQENLPEAHREHSGWHWFLTFSGLTFHVAHFVPVTQVYHYRSTPISREMLHTTLHGRWSALHAEAQVKYQARITIRAHAHYYWHSESARTDGFNLPCWQAWSPFMLKRSPLKIAPDIGYLGCLIYPDGRVHWHKKLWEIDDVAKTPHSIVW